ncbi:tRNA methyltransferase 2 [Irineochytrium annulatum]|nr:tRNA methyltransferase 2 [Irineochytrium annulatum]
MATERLTRGSLPPAAESDTHAYRDDYRSIDRLDRDPYPRASRPHPDIAQHHTAYPHYDDRHSRDSRPYTATYRGDFRSISPGKRAPLSTGYLARSPRISRSRSPPGYRGGAGLPVEEFSVRGGEPMLRRRDASPDHRPKRHIERGSSLDRRSTTQIFLGNLPYTHSERDVIAFAERFGPVEDVTLPMDRFTKKNKGFCFLQFRDRRDAEDFFEEMSKTGTINGRRLKVDWDIGKEKKGIDNSARLFSLKMDVDNNKRPLEDLDDEDVDSKRLKGDDDGDDHPEAAAKNDERKKFSLKLVNLPKNTSDKDVKKALPDGLGYRKLKKVFKHSYATLDFTSEEERAAAVEKLKDLTIGKAAASVKIELLDHSPDAPAIPVARPKDPNDTRTPEEQIKDQVTPLWRMPYEEQLREKTIEFKQQFGNFKTKLLGFLTNKDLTAEKKAHLDWLKNNGKGNPICRVENALPSPILAKYRNKCEFSFGEDQEGRRTIGFMLGLFKDGIVTVLAHLRKSAYSIYDRVKRTGFWRLMQVRTHETGEIMVLIQVSPTELSAEDMKAEKEGVKRLFEDARKAGRVDVTTVLWQEADNVHNGMLGTPPEVLFGPGYVHEELLGLRFRISSASFFQVNTKATELLYSRVREWCALETLTLPTVTDATAEESKDAAPAPTASTTTTEPAATAAPASPPGIVLLDLCCGTGTIGITMASSVKLVVGVDIVEQAIEDARANAAANGVSNCVYVAGKIEDVIKDIVKDHVRPGDVAVAVLDPPRNGVSSKVIQAVRACEAIQRVIYVSCDFKQAFSNVIDLCRPPTNKHRGTPFRPARAVPVDLFPNSKPCELLMEYRRHPDPFFEMLAAEGSNRKKRATADGMEKTGEAGETGEWVLVQKEDANGDGKADNTVMPLPGHKWDLAYMHMLGIYIHDVADISTLYGVSRPSAFKHQTEVDLLRTLDLSSKTKIQVAYAQCKEMDSRAATRVSDVVKPLLTCLYFKSDRETSVVDLAKAVIRMIGISDGVDVIISGRAKLDLGIAGSDTQASPDILVEYGTKSIILVTQEDKRVDETVRTPPEGHLVAGIVASYRANCGATQRSNQTIYGIITRGFHSMFYRCDMTKDAYDSIMFGYKSATEVLKIYRYVDGEYPDPAYGIDAQQRMNLLECYECLRLALERLKLELDTPAISNAFLRANTIL